MNIYHPKYPCVALSYINKPQINSSSHFLCLLFGRRDRAWARPKTICRFLLARVGGIHPLIQTTSFKFKVNSWMYQKLNIFHIYTWTCLTFSQELPKSLGAGLIPNHLAVAAAMAAAVTSNQLALRSAGPVSHHHHHLLQGTPLSLLRPAPGPMRTTHGPILFTPYWWRGNEEEAHCEEEACNHVPSRARSAAVAQWT